jgi:hypothetical protein
MPIGMAKDPRPFGGAITLATLAPLWVLTGKFFPEMPNPSCLYAWVFTMCWTRKTRRFDGGLLKFRSHPAVMWVFSTRPTAENQILHPAQEGLEQQQLDAAVNFCLQRSCAHS